jgi:probable HAF family extracellular repeat protein
MKSTESLGKARLRAFSVVIPLVLVALGAGASAGRSPSLLATDLGTLGGTESSASAINRSGQVVGGAAFRGGGGDYDAFLWSKGKMVDLGRLAPNDPDADSMALAVNDSGQVVGWSHTSFGDLATHGFLWSAGKLTDLGTLGGQELDSTANDINNAGQIVGAGTIGGDVLEHAVMWSQGKMTDLGTLGTYRESSASAINEAGQIVGFSWSITTSGGKSTLAEHAVLWADGKITDLGTLHGGCSAAEDINDHGRVVGSSGSCAQKGKVRAVSWWHGKATNLGTLGPRNSYAHGINNRGEVVGSTYTPKHVPDHAFLWSRGRIHDLGSLYGTLCCAGSYASGINDSGQIVGFSYLLGGGYPPHHAVLWRKGRGVTVCYRGKTVRVTRQIAKELRKRGAKPGACRKPKKR